MNQCDRIQEQIMDHFEDDFRLTEETKVHMESCQDCKIFYDKLVLLNNKLQVDPEEIEVDHQLIRTAVAEGTARRERRERLIGNVIFICAAIVLFVLIGVTIGLGYGMAVLVLQALIVFVSPVIIPVTIFRQMKGAR